jgi:hypothetical protein
MGPDNSPPPDESGPVDPYARALALFDQCERTDTQKLEQWALDVARPNDRLRVAGQRMADHLASLRTPANRDAIDQLLHAWRHVLAN